MYFICISHFHSFGLHNTLYVMYIIERIERRLTFMYKNTNKPNVLPGISMFYMGLNTLLAVFFRRLFFCFLCAILFISLPVRYKPIIHNENAHRG